MILSDTKSKDYSWNNSLLLDIPVIDKQHQKFFSMFDEIALLNSNEVKTSQIQVEKLLKELSLYTIYHFKIEENLIEKSGTPNIIPHQEQHAIFKEKINNFMIAQSYENKVLVNELIVFLRKWFIIHINGVDVTYIEDVKKHLDKKP